MSVYADRLEALEKAKYPDIDDDMDMYSMTDAITWMADRIEQLEATLRKLEYWFDTDQEILDVMGNNEKADHMRKLKMIRDALKGDSDG